MKHFLISLLLFTLYTNAQEDRVRQASLLFDDYEYVDAIDDYAELVDDGHSDQKTFMNLGDANYNNANYAEAANWYSKLMDHSEGKIDPEYLYRYAQSLKSQEKYEESDKWMQNFIAKKANDQRAKLFGASTNYLEKIGMQSDRVVIKNMSLNSPHSDFAPTFFGERLVFSTARDYGRTQQSINTWSESPFLNLYSAKKDEKDSYGAMAKLSNRLNSKAHESSTAFTKDGKTIYFTRNNFEKQKFLRDVDGVSRLKIFRATLKKGKWQNITELPFNSDAYSVAHPTLSPDETKLFFSSDMPGSLGQSDIWMVDINDDGTYGKPQNLGAAVNTEARETFPFVASDNTLYFASDGHPGLGGLDIFAIKFLDRPKTRAFNVGQPINSPQDDFSFIMDLEIKEGFFASNRPGGRGNDDIYGFKEVYPLDFSCENQVTVQIKQAETATVLKEANLSLYDGNGQKIDREISFVDDSFQFYIDCTEEGAKLRGNLDGYEENELLLNLSKNSDGKYELFLNPKKTEVTVEPIYFDFDHSIIRSDSENAIVKVMTYLGENPEGRVKIASHTDSRGTNSYNQKLSEKRAAATKNYFMAQGVDASRLVTIGFGETQLTNECDDFTPCSEEKHQENRRSEFTLMDKQD